MGGSTSRGRFVSNRRMEHTAPQPLADNTASTDQRLTDLEIKVSFADDTLEQLNQVVIRQQKEIDWLLREVQQLRQQMPPDGAAPRFAAASDELPPHY